MITKYDLDLMTQLSIHYNIKIEILKENGTILDVLQGTIVGGSASIDSTSSVRRTFSVTLIPTLFDRNDTKISEEGVVWINKELRLYLGVLDLRKQEYIYYSMGHYVYTNTSGNYDATTNQLVINCNDYISKLDGTKNGQLGALTTRIPAYEENPNTGAVIKYNVIREAMVTVLTQLGYIRNYVVDDIGEYKAMPQNNDKWQDYRKENTLWNAIPYDLEFSSGISVLTILEKLRDLYPNYEMFFDTQNTFICQMIPSCYRDNIVFSNEFLKSIYVSENTSTELNKVRNICEVWGKVIDADFYTENCTYANNLYTCTINGYDEKYYNGDIVAIKIPSANSADAKININGLGAISIMDENTDTAIKSNALEKGVVFVFKIKSKRINNTTVFYAYLLGHWQAHGLNVLTDGTIGDNYKFSDGTTLKKYSKEYFQKKYNCESIEFQTIQNSPFTVQKIGEILDVKTGGEYENITSDSLALSRAEWENWKNARLTDSITLTTNLVPFYDVNIKVSYQTSDSDRAEQYIIKSVSHDFSSWTSTITMYKFYPLYDDIVKEMGTHKALSEYKHGVLSKYTHKELEQLIGGENY
ncbi:DUF5048 domain-containing protein [Kineothrix sp. MB12-C1]|uniref:DUF5048 domain-containing protein n=1 Tax=Kineothrix sp. MB12-C1 TaxID=3070215 RepID=UPI0027D34902|nr:DUF5048 domain-containing protein [Kineothrix sp. MB12-C1]WMC93161.1 DUF5048 domain-containing protein [Kineothrix sp. MB12-C1]